jgi:hypothetical protein
VGRGAQSPGSHVLSSSQSEMARVASRDAHLRLEVSVGACRGLSFLLEALGRTGCVYLEVSVGACRGLSFLLEALGRTGCVYIIVTWVLSCRSL